MCHRALERIGPHDRLGDGLLGHPSSECAERYPVIGGIPRLLVGGQRGILAARRRSWFAADSSRRELGDKWAGGPRLLDPIVRGFDLEWSLFRQVGTPELREVFALYFDLVPDQAFAPDRIVLDAGCGAGRWSCEVAARGPRVVAVDLGFSVEIAQQNAAGSDRIACVQADLRRLPLAPRSMDWSYSLGVLHHVEPAEEALAQIVAATRVAGMVLLYLYYALDYRAPAYRSLFGVVDLARRATSRSPRPLTVAFAAIAAVTIYWPLARVSRLANGLGRRRLADALPLSFYRERSLALMFNDSLDRFGSMIERRYTQAQVTDLMRNAGLEAVRFSPAPPYWHALGMRRE